LFVRCLIPECKVCGRWISEHSEEQVEKCRKRASLVRDEPDDDYDDDYKESTDYDDGWSKSLQKDADIAYDMFGIDKKDRS